MTEPARSTTVVLPEEKRDEIDDRRHSTTSRSEWIREAIQARLDAEDRGDWDEIAPDAETEPSTTTA